MSKNELKQGNKKKILKLAGNAVTILAIIFVAKKLMGLEVDYTALANPKSWLGIIVMSVIYGLIIIIYGWPWSNYVQMITHTRLPYIPVANVMAKSNLLKYIPGNVFQYIGRNELAVQKNLKHGEVGMATICDVATNLFAAAVLGSVFYFEGFKKVVAQFGTEIAIVITVLAVLLVIVLVVLWFKKRELVEKYVCLLQDEKNLLTILTNFGFYVVNMFINAGLYIATLCVVLNMNLKISDIYVIMGAFMLSWIVGFIVPGAPGGIGIREFVITLLIPGEIDVQMVLFGIVVYRLINIFGDMFGFLFTSIMNKWYERKIA